ncbi:YheC/YheD family protein [Alteribacter aurantiacus]|uniref:YheC/YheD family endospore coat-associated protein n=1 Tax=Alteribacter aurantiacus TaxID=254410 RepID=UPI000429D2CC|nr:YheC/YheD family protein [Alteribacter aurantiacus]
MHYWIRINEMRSGESSISVPQDLYSQVKKINAVQHGRNTYRCTVVKKTSSKGKGTKSNPYLIDVSSSFIRKSHLIPDLPYQIIKEGTTLKFGPVTAIIINRTSRLNDRKQIISKLGGVLISARPNSFNWEKGTVRGEYYHTQKKRWIYTTLPLPEVIFNRYTLGKAKRRALLKHCKEKEILFFNTRRYDKKKIEKVMSEVGNVKDHVIKSTLIRGPQDVFSALKSHKKIVLKPTGSARGKGIVFIKKKTASSYLIYNYRSTSRGINSSLSKAQLKTFLNTFDFRRQEYIAQKWISFMTYTKRPFDLRVHMHKDDKEWKCAGIECRVAGKGQKLTNVSKGGKAVTFSQALTSYSSAVRKKLRSNVIDVTKNVCKALDERFPSDHFADLGIDIAIDKQKGIHFIEINFHPQFNGFRKMDYKIYKKINRQPLIHATKKQGFVVK